MEAERAVYLLINSRMGSSCSKPNNANSNSKSANTNSKPANPPANPNSKSANTPANAEPGTTKGGYRPTKKDKNALKRWKQGKSIGFTMRSSLKAKGLIPRANGTRRVSNKYK